MFCVFKYLSDLDFHIFNMSDCKVQIVLFNFMCRGYFDIVLHFLTFIYCNFYFKSYLSCLFMLNFITSSLFLVFLFTNSLSKFKILLSGYSKSSVRFKIMSFIIIMVFLINGAVPKVGQKDGIEVLRHNSQELIHKENIGHRELAASATSTPATITTSDTITVTATDTDGAGQLYEISFNNECTVSAPGLTCTAVGGQEQVLDSSSTSSMTDNGDGTYTSTISVTRPGKITINVFKYTQGGVLVEYYSGTTYSGGVQHAEIRGDLNIDYGSGNLFGSTSDSVSAKMYFKLKGPSTESITLQLEADDTADLSLGGSSIVSASIGTNTNTFSSTLNTMYDGQINFVENTATAKVVLSWSYTSVAMTTVPGTNLYYKAYVSSPMQLTINCPDGYSKTTSAGRPVCETVCGDSKRAGSEECDDGNIVATVDGCTSLCAIDSGWECHGGTPTAQDTCTQCAAGYAPNAAKDACVTTCGDGKRAGSEECDDANTSGTTDGCSASCTIDSGWECHNGNPTTQDTCTQCAAGFSPNAAKNACVTTCGDSKKAGLEECDDGNTSGTTDGCSATCTIDSGWECHDGTPTAQDTCTQCAAGYSPNAAKNACVTVCGDGKRAGTEECDDGNTLATVDGCSSTCAIDSGWECHNGNPTTQDTCTQCPAGFYPNSAKNACETHCGDGKRAGSETCDDNNVRNGDGCTGTCTIESNWICNGGTTSSSDSCTFCEPGYTANNVPATQVCVSTCGDKMQVGSEKCDDGNTNGSDGCAADCSAVESGWVCANSTFSSGDVCTQCTSGFYQNDATYPTACVPQCGDSKRAGSEKCDNGDISGATGCSSDCLSITAGWVCTGGTTTTADTCTQCTAGFYQNDASNPTTCVPQCGDGLEAGTEKCDDGNTVAGDGCAADCTTVEAGWVCSGGSTTSEDECYKCADGYTQNNAANPTTCVTTCGDGFEAGTEKCDDGNISGSDGCAADCSTVEAGWVCIGGSPTSSDTCTQCTAGFYQNDATNPETCVTTCGDGLEAGAEKCDDGNTIANDGCAADCTSVDAGWVCSGGSTTSQDTCTKCQDGFYQNNPTNPEVCVTLCGDGFEAGTEKCDDGNTISGDGCAADCTTVESGWVCKYGTPTTADVCEQCTAGYVQNDSSNPEYCVPSCGDGLRVGNELCDDANTSSNDGCSSDCSKIESGYICIGGSTGSKDTCNKCPLSYSPNEEQRKCEINPIPTRAKQISYFYAIVSGVGLLLNIFMILKYNHSYISIFRTIFHIQMLYLLPLLGDKMGNDGVGFLRNFKFILATFKELPNDWVFFGCRSMFSFLDYSQENSYLPLIGIKSGSAIVNCYNLVWVSSVLSLLTGVSFLFFWKPKYPDFAKKMLKVLFRLAIRIIMLAYIFIAICAFSEIRDYKRVSKGFLSYLISIAFSGVLIFTVALCAYFCLRKIPAEEQVDTSFTIEYFVGVRKDKLARSYIILWFIRRTAFVGVIFMLDYLNNALILTILVLIQLLYILAILQTQAFTTKKDNILEVFNEICYLLLIPASLYYGPSLKMVDHSMIYLFINIAQTIIEFIVCLSEITIRLKKKMKVIKPDETIEVKRKTLAAQSMTSDRIIHSKNIYDRDNENVGINNYATQENPPSENSQNMSSANSQNSQNVFTNNSTKQLHTIREIEEIPDKSEIQIPDVSDPKIYEEFKKNWGFGQYKSQKDKFSNFS
ncbi:unnamed protein product [Moneuplotes crassus]|uniref:PA14 domain-containing protein n=1 Tax=Euplotes crassus TaxID=5936 RepID=A0AAD1Y933_EUPCR|nr:unnamed protein product [Moneuplotes crassus]